MNSALSRLASIKDLSDLSQTQAAFVIGSSQRAVARLTQRRADGTTKLGCVRPEGRGDDKNARVNIPRVDIVLYLARRHSRPADFLAEVERVTPEYADTVRAVLFPPKPESLPANVVSIEEGQRPDASKKPRAKRHHTDPYADHPVFAFPA